MGISLRCCLACVLPCGALDLIRIVHLNGHVEEISRPITAGNILQANPNHVLSKPCSNSVDVRRNLILSPDDELKRGSIYFLIPDSSLQSNDKSNSERRLHTRSPKNVNDENNFERRDFQLDTSSDVVVLPDKKSISSRRFRRSRGEISNWTPRLQSICEG